LCNVLCVTKEIYVLFFSSCTIVRLMTYIIFQKQLILFPWYFPLYYHHNIIQIPVDYLCSSGNPAWSSIPQHFSRVLSSLSLDLHLFPFSLARGQTYPGPMELITIKALPKILVQLHLSGGWVSIKNVWLITYNTSRRHWPRVSHFWDIKLLHIILMYRTLLP